MHKSEWLWQFLQVQINFGLTLSIWDYIFGAANIAYSGKEILLGFPGVNGFPESFYQHAKLGFTKNNFGTSEYQRIIE